MAERGSDGWSGRLVLRWTLILALLLALGGFLYLIRTTVFLLLVAFLIAYLLDPIVERLEAWRVPRSIGVLLVSVAFLGMLVAVVWVILPEVRYQVQVLSQRVPQWAERLYTWAQPVLQRLHISLDAPSIEAFIQRALKWVQANLPRLREPAQRVLQGMFTGIAGFIVGVYQFIMVPVMAFYLLRDYNRIGPRLYSLLPPAWRPVVREWLREIDQAVGGFLRGQFLIALFLAVYYAVGLSLLRVPLGFLLGILSGLANIVPYMSLVVGMIPAALLAFLDQPSLWRVLWVLALFESGQLIEGLILGPRIMGRQTGLHPVTVILAILIGGTLMGLWGVFLAVPAAALLKAVFRRWMALQQSRWQAAADGQGKPDGSVENRPDSPQVA
jgi:predicted PurR-regulated permease PerM